MATHSSVLAWRIPGTGEPGGCRLWGCTELDTTEATQQQQQYYSPQWLHQFTFPPTVQEGSEKAIFLKVIYLQTNILSTSFHSIEVLENAVQVLHVTQLLLMPFSPYQQHFQSSGYLAKMSTSSALLSFILSLHTYLTLFSVELSSLWGNSNSGTVTHA